ncbi:DUF885 domain-containing protein [Gluconacetobacter takamatsuzukensis]|uniref:DUF885 domain-containing protein n=1 Tax=Gluconacetobacter takamatsuzukensis TaxID=1286190 RepID=A0A7W4KET2_9PROT|nr:DUF885 domain-containing protein [Gluconacetobacter takamatsuzukensis]MBB2205530.1 DUF885 domain-containing protein [Gluconacetobacter takamatsuzukensis]
MKTYLLAAPLCGYLLAAALAAPAAADPMPAGEVVSLFDEWRAFAAPARNGGVADYSPASLARWQAGLDRFRRRTAADQARYTDVTSAVDLKLIMAEINGLDFNLRVLRPWARDPSFYATVFAEESDVPAHEAQWADQIDLFAWSWPLDDQGAKDLAARLRTVAPLLDRARTWLATGNAADLWRYGDHALTAQIKALSGLLDGTLRMRTHEGHVPASLVDAPVETRQAAQAALAATQSFRDWVRKQAPGKTGPSGIGIENYNWYMKNVQLVPYDWTEQVALLRRELARAWAGLAEEELHNRGLPPLEKTRSPEAYAAFDQARLTRYIDFLVAKGLIADTPYNRTYLQAQKIGYVPPDKRDFFTNVTALDPVPLYSHDIHWVELARIAHDTNPDPVRRGAPLFNIYAARSEGFATAFEEIVMRSGFYDDEPRGRELVWIMAANRAARGLASLYVQANRITLAEAGKFHASWTPRHYSDPTSALVGFEQLLYLRQPGYGTSYITGKLLLDRLIAARAQATTGSVEAVVPETLQAMYRAGILPWPLVEESLGVTGEVVP